MKLLVGECLVPIVHFLKIKIHLIVKGQDMDWRNQTIIGFQQDKINRLQIWKKYWIDLQHPKNKVDSFVQDHGVFMIWMSSTSTTFPLDMTKTVTLIVKSLPLFFLELRLHNQLYNHNYNMNKFALMVINYNNQHVSYKGEYQICDLNITDSQS